MLATVSRFQGQRRRVLLAVCAVLGLAFVGHTLPAHAQRLPEPAVSVPSIDPLVGAIALNRGEGLISGASRSGPPAASRPAQKDPRFGLNQAWENGPVSDQAGAGWSRLTFWWSAFQPRGTGDWNFFATDNDSGINDELRRGRELSGVVLNVPDWASTNGTPNGVPKNLYLPWNDPQNYWGQFMKRLAEMYRGKINLWIIWNEVDIPAGDWKTWDGTLEDYAQLMKVAYQAVKAGNPQAQVAHYGSPWWYDYGDFLTRLMSRLAADPEARANNFFFDLGNLHLYSRAADSPRIIPWYRTLLESVGIPAKPLIIGETNAIPYDDPIWDGVKGGFHATMDEQASYLVEAFATFIAQDIRHIGVNRLRDGSDFEAGGEPFGLLRNNGTQRPAFKAFQVVTRYFAGTRPVDFHPTDPSGLTWVVLERDGERITVVWTLKPKATNVAIEALAPNALLVGKYGDTQTVTMDERGFYLFELSPATANTNEEDPDDYVVGGDPVILVERFDGGIPLAQAL